MGDSQEYHEAHLAFARADIVKAAAKRESIIDRLHAYAADARRAERDRLADERSFMCEDCATEADEEVQTLRDQIEEMRRAARALRRACQDAGSPTVPTSVAEAIAVVTALGGQ